MHCASRIHYLAGIEAGAVLRAVLSLMPLDDFVDDGAVTMQVVGDAGAIPEAVAGVRDHPRRA